MHRLYSKAHYRGYYEDKWASLIAQLVKKPPAMQETLLDSWVRKICWRRDRLSTPGLLGLPDSSVGKIRQQCRTPWFDSWVREDPLEKG